MRCFRLLGWTLLILGAVGRAQATELLNDRPFAVGEVLRYRIRLGPVTVGEAMLAIPGLAAGGGRAAFEVCYTARSGGVLSTLYPVRDRITSWADTLDYRSYRLQKRIREGTYHEACDWRIDHAQGRAVERDGVSIPVEPGVHDVFSALLRVRASQLVSGTAITIPVVLGSDTAEMRVSVGPQRSVATPAGEFWCVAVQPDLGGQGPFQHDGPVVIDLALDRRRWPVRIRLKVPVVGALVVELVEAIGPA
ncbi:MAG TPA: DUF3108 domain-containing protein [Candidatus Krumholzibacteria bacterium]|nr:DUF3108 domain-containing protein [Candidatus Krumholzibacteria bacterium]HPD70508.1 DUF3108 domain-containing protein [Candidatus Krumholzibacteria bacterium]HRY39792.1 DUF3108 domain-containing protein [Candidatus Krumholzibacteria bacterium]